MKNMNSLKKSLDLTYGLGFDVITILSILIRRHVR